MKKIIFTGLAAMLLSMASFAQNYTVTVSGTVMTVIGNMVTPVPGQAVIITIDSTNFGLTYQNTVYTDDSGNYTDVIALPGFSDYAYLQAMTYDSCLGNYQYNGAMIMPGVTIPPLDFYLCNYVTPECQAYFYYYQADPTNPYTIAFENMSTGNYTEVSWDFGDSTYSNEMYPVHTFPGEGTWYVCLTISDGADCYSTYCEFVYLGGSPTGCENSFFYTMNEPNTLTFEGYLLNGQYADYYSWDFGDGTYGTGQTVTHTYNPQGMGIYMVGLTTYVMDPNTYDSCIYTSYMEVWVENNPGGCESFILPLNMYGLTVEFEGYTVSPYETQYTWEFGDGVTGSGQYVTHNYSYPGMYTVTLQTIDATGCDFQTFTQIWLDSTNTGGGCNTMFSYEQAENNTFNFYGYIYFNNGMIYPDSSAVYSWDFGDGTTGTGQAITHYFQENPAGGYNVCLTATSVSPDGTTCTATYCEFVSTVMPSWDIFGYIYLENNTLADQAVVHLMTMDTLWQGVVEVQSTTIDSGGFYNFSDVPLYNSRLYFVQAELTEGSAYFGQYMPTYHLSALSWEQAMPILPLNNWTYDIFMIPGSTVESGAGSITGIVSNLGARSSLDNVEVVLMNGDKTPLQYTRSDEQGHFSFNNLAMGVYVIHAEIMGIHTIQAEVTLSEQEPTASVEVQINGDEANVVFGIPEKFVSLKSVGNIYPNPLNEASGIDITLEKESSVEISFVSITGQLVKSEKVRMQEGSNYYQIETSSIPGGIYMLRILTKQGDMVTRRLVKTR